jgi:hydroxyethylthiazole kinase-like uncharacterized protein yjeF
MPALYDTPTLRAAEARDLAALGPLALMRRAARALSDAVTELSRSGPPRAPILALVGPGNNGADALLATLELRMRGFDARALLLSTVEPQAGDARAAHAMAKHAGVPLGDTLTGQELAGALVIDGLFGIGLRRPLEGKAAEWIAAVNRVRSPLIAVDVPSGINADTGSVVGGSAASAALARMTVTFLGDKPGLHTGAGRVHAGKVRVELLEVDAGCGQGTLIARDEARTLARPLRRRPDSHKGSHGHVAVLGGSQGMRGAAMLAAHGAHRSGAGKVSVGTPDGWRPDPGLTPHLMSLSAGQRPREINAWVVGCGLGQGYNARRQLLALLSDASSPLVIDADALNLVALDALVARAVQRCAQPRVLTPHPLEAARLLGVPTAAIQSDRIASARALADRLQSVVVLKGAGTVCADPAGQWAIVDAGSPALATAGTGDVLAGVIGGLLAQGLTVASAACLAGWVHARAGELAASRRAGTIGLAACELPILIADALNELIAVSDDACA